MRHSIREDSGGPICFDPSISKEGFRLIYDRLPLLSEQIFSRREKKIYTSPFIRTIMTSTVLQDELKVSSFIISPELSEGLTLKSFPTQPRIPEYLDLYFSKANIKWPESYTDIEQRCKTFLKKLNSKDICIVVTHGIIYNILLSLLYPAYKFEVGKVVDPDQYIPRYCDFTILIEQDGVYKIKKSTMEVSV